MSRQIPRVEESSKFNFITSIWIVPFIAVIIAAWLAYQYFSQLGPEIRIVFPKNEGLKAGQSQIKYRDVPIGTVMKIELEKDGEGVAVIARMDKSATNYMNENTKFWIVKPEVGMSGVSGLDTLISGTYIDMYTKKGAMLKKKFRGMRHAYRKINDGEYFHLKAPIGYNIGKSTPIYFKNIKVGQVEYMNVSLDGSSIDFVVFIEKFYVPYVHSTSKFWVTSALDVDLSNGRLDVNVAPLSYILNGGIAFSSTGEDNINTIPSTFVFHLYKNGSIADGKKIGQGGDAIKEFSIVVKDSVAKLKRDASVRYDGFDVGHVKEIKLSYDVGLHKMLGKVLLEIDTSSFRDDSDLNHTGEENFYKAVEEGLRAKVTPSNPITGMLFVDLVFEDSNHTKSISHGGKYPILPTIAHNESGIIDTVEAMLAKLSKLPLEELVTSLNTVIADAGKVVLDTGKVVKSVDKPLATVLKDLKETVNNLNKMTNKKSFTTMPDEVNKTLKELTHTLKATKKVVKGYGNNSLITQQIAQTLKVVSKTSLEMQHFLKMLNRKPNSLIFGDR